MDANGQRFKKMGTSHRMETEPSTWNIYPVQTPSVENLYKILSRETQATSLVLIILYIGVNYSLSTVPVLP